jgi:hemolysin D
MQGSGISKVSYGNSALTMRASRSVRGLSRRDESHRVIQEYQSEVAELQSWREPARLRLTLYLLAALVLSVFALSFVLRLDRVVTTVRGQVVSVDTNIVLQALDDSIIRAIHVKEGDEVRAGQHLVTLDPTFAAAEANQFRLQLANLQAQSARLEAESEQRPFVWTARNAQADDYGALQQALFRQRADQFSAQLQSYDEKIAQTHVTIIRWTSDADRLRKRLKIFEEIEAMRVTLEEKRAGSRLQLLQATDQRIELARNLELALNSLREASHQLSGLQSDREAFVKQWFGAIAQELVTVRQAQDAAQEQLAKAQKREELVGIDAPEDGVVLKLVKLSAGSIIKSGGEVLQIVPLRARLEAEVEVSSDDIAFIRPNDPATIKLEAFDYIEHGWAEGRVRWISEGAFTVDDNGQMVPPFYRARLDITKLNFKNVPDSMRLVPGMRVTADIDVGTRTVFAYLFHGIIRSAGEAMRER